MSLLCKNLSLQLIKFCKLIEPCSAMCLCKKVWLCLSCMHRISQFSILTDYLILLSKQFFTLSEIGFDQFWIFCEIRRWFSLTIRLPKSFLKKSIKVRFLKFSISNKSLPTDKRLLLLLESKITKHQISISIQSQLLICYLREKHHCLWIISKFITKHSQMIKIVVFLLIVKLKQLLEINQCWISSS